MGTPSQELSQLFILLSTPGLTALPVRVVIPGEVQLEAMGPGQMDRVRVLLSRNGGVDYDLLTIAQQSWWTNAPTLVNAIQQGWLLVNTDGVTSAPPVPAPNPNPLPVGYRNSLGTAGSKAALEDHVHQKLDETVQVLSYSASVVLDFDITLPAYRDLTLAGDVTFTTANLKGGRAIVIRIAAGASLRDFTFPAGWVFLTSAAPASIAANKTGVLSITAFGATDATVIAAYAVEF